jgi:methylmalonyl-CoA mutase
MDLLFKEFSPVTAQQWKEQIVKDLKATDFKDLFWKTNNGTIVKPFFTSEDQEEKVSPLFRESDWDVCEQIRVKDEKAANERALTALKGGASGLSFYIHKKINAKILLKDISLEHIYTQFFISNDALHILDDLKEFYGKTNPFDGKIKCFVNIDPLCLFAFFGEWHDDEDKDLSVLKQLMHIPVNVSLYQEAGANTINELAFGLAHLNEYFNYLDKNKSLKNKTLHFTFSAGGDFFNEIAKLRAFRKLVTLLQEQYKTNFPLHIHAQTAQINKSSIDAYTNMLRTTTEGMSAVIGGCNSLCVLPFDEGFESGHETDTNLFGARISRNQQHVFKEESYLNKVADISSGSYYLETLTGQLAEQSWEQFKAIESNGGFVASLKNNFIQNIIEKDAENILSQVKEGKLILVGVNKYQNPKEAIKDSSYVVLPVKDEKKKPVKRIEPLRLAYSFEREKVMQKLD